MVIFVGDAFWLDMSIHVYGSGLDIWTDSKILSVLRSEGASHALAHPLETSQLV